MIKFASSYPEHQVYDDGVTLAAAAARVADGNTQNDFEVVPDCSVLLLATRFTNAETLAGDTCDVYIQTYLQDQWVDVYRFTRVLGNGANALTYFYKLNPIIAMTEFEIGAGLVALDVRDLLAERWAARWAIAGTGSFTFDVKIQPIK